MITTLPNVVINQQYELKLSQQKDPMQRLLLIDKMTDCYTFTNIRRATELLEEQAVIFQTHDYPDFKLNYELNRANLDNQLYNFDAAEQHFLAAIEILEERGTVKQLAETFIDYAGTLMNLERLEEAAEKLDKAAKLLKNFPDQRLSAYMTCREGFMNLHYKNYSRAIELLLNAEKTIQRMDPPLVLKDRYFLTLIHSGLGRVYERNDEYPKSVRAYMRVIEICESMPMRSRLSWHYLNVGNGYMAMDEQENAEAYFQKAIEVTDDNSPNARAGAYANLGFCYFDREMYSEALELFDRAELLYKENSEEDYYNFSIIESWRGRLYSEIDEPDLALAHFALAYENASLTEDNRQMAIVCKDMAAFYAELEDFKNAYEYQLLHDKFAEQYSEEVNKRQQMELEVQYEADKKKQETELLRLQATKLQLKALRAQMNPHFMYNALNSIQHFITSNDVSSAAKYLAKFATLMRQSLDHSDLEIISLEKEIDFLENYLYINEKLRFQEKLNYKIVVDDEIEEDILGVPTMIVQPYVENAIEHGLRSRDNGSLTVTFSFSGEEDEETILCVVEDNGIGREKAAQLKMEDPQFQNHRSKGTRITEERLSILHNSKEELFVEIIDLKHPETGEAEGTRVEIQIPIMEIQMK